MASIENPRKEFQFNVIIPGMNPMLVQKFKLPDIDFDVTEHADTNFLVKTAGIIKIGKASFEKLSVADGQDSYIWDWIKSIQNTKLGGGALPSQYKRNILIEQYSNDGVTVIQYWELEGAWPSKLNGISFDRATSGNTIESIEFEVDEVE